MIVAIENPFQAFIKKRISSRLQSDISIKCSVSQKQDFFKSVIESSNHNVGLESSVYMTDSSLLSKALESSSFNF